MTSLFRPNKVGAIDPVGITKASATNVRKMRARTNAKAYDSTISRVASCGGPCVGFFKSIGGSSFDLSLALGTVSGRLTLLISISSKHSGAMVFEEA